MTNESRMAPRHIVTALALLLAAAMFANGLSMLANPLAWYGRVPGVVETGPFNQHFIRDIGMIYALIGLAFATGAFVPRVRALLWSGASLWLATHALFHFWEVAVGICSADAIPRDFVGVTLPALTGLALSIWAWRR